MLKTRDSFLTKHQTFLHSTEVRKTSRKANRLVCTCWNLKKSQWRAERLLYYLSGNLTPSQPGFGRLFLLPLPVYNDHMNEKTLFQDYEFKSNLSSSDCQTSVVKSELEQPTDSILERERADFLTTCDGVFFAAIYYVKWLHLYPRLQRKLHDWHQFDFRQKMLQDSTQFSQIILKLVTVIFLLLRDTWLDSGIH